jgi:hypothetical protein
MPAEARGTSKKSAKAFVRYYFVLINNAITTGDTEPLLRYGRDGCQSCSTIAENVDEIYDAGGSIKSLGWGLKGIYAVPQQPRSRPVFDLDVRLSPQEVRPRSGAKVKHYEGGKQPMTIHLSRQKDGWTVTQLDKVA